MSRPRHDHGTFLIKSCNLLRNSDKLLVQVHSATLAGRRGGMPCRHVWLGEFVFPVMFTPPRRFNSSPLKSYRNPIGSRIVFQSHHFSGVNSLLNFGGVRDPTKIQMTWIYSRLKRNPSCHLLKGVLLYILCWHRGYVVYFQICNCNYTWNLRYQKLLKTKNFWKSWQNWGAWRIWTWESGIIIFTYFQVFMCQNSGV